MLALAAMTGLNAGGVAQAGLEPFIGEISTFGSNFCPQGWAKAEGQLLSISTETSALFSLIGTTYGGDGQTTFALPDLRGRIIIGVGQGPGLSTYAAGDSGGAEQVTLGVNEAAAHGHALTRDAAQPVSVRRTNKGGVAQARSITAGAQQSTQSVGGGQPHENRMPYLAVTTCIALQGIFPQRQ